MPLRDYKCRVCGHEWEELRKDQSDPGRCSVCKCDTVDRMLTSHGSFKFGDGASYQNGYKGKSNG